MGGIKIHPPNQLPEGSLSEQEFQKWKIELEMYLSSEDKFALYLPGETYCEWKPGEEGEKRIRQKWKRFQARKMMQETHCHRQTDLFASICLPKCCEAVIARYLKRAAVKTRMSSCCTPARSSPPASADLSAACFAGQNVAGG